MSSDFAELYQEIILDHYKRPHNKKVLDGRDVVIHENPTCGDSLKVAVDYNENGSIKNVFFDGHGCAICMASASIMTENFYNILPDDAKTRVEDFVSILRGEGDVENLETFGDAAAFKTLTAYPVRVKCATLAWHALQGELEKGS